MKVINILLVAASVVACVAADSDLPCPLMCTLESNPQCGTFVGTFPNPCSLQVAKCLLGKYGLYLKSSSAGKCNCDIACTREYRPVCGSDGTTYSNPCVLGAAICNGTRAGQVATGACPH